MEFVSLGEKERDLLLTAIGLPTKGLRCAYCTKTVSYKTCSIMPSKDEKVSAVITCDSPLCIAEYLTSQESFDKKIVVGERSLANITLAALKVDENKRQDYIRFMIKRFGNRYTDKSYADEWAGRFNKGSPQKYMDEESLRIHSKIIAKKI